MSLPQHQQHWNKMHIWTCHDMMEVYQDGKDFCLKMRDYTHLDNCWVVWRLLVFQCLRLELHPSQQPVHHNNHPLRNNTVTIKHWYMMTNCKQAMNRKQGQKTTQLGSCHHHQMSLLSFLLLLLYYSWILHKTLYSRIANPVFTRGALTWTLAWG